MRKVGINLGFDNIQFPNGGSYSSGAVVYLSDVEYGRLRRELFPNVLTDLGEVEEGNHEAQEGDFEITDPNRGLVLRSPDMTRWRVTIDNNGNLMRQEL